MTLELVDDKPRPTMGAHEVHRGVVEQKRKATIALIVMGAFLEEMQVRGLYHDYADTWSEYIAMPEITIAPSTDRRARYIARTWLPLGFSPEQLADVGISKLEIAAKRLTSGEDPRGILSDAEALSVTDLKTHYRELDGEVVEDRPRRYRVWVGYWKAVVADEGVCFTPLSDEAGVGAEQYLEDPRYIGVAEVDAEQLYKHPDYDVWTA
jgi:hypothetical protein